MRLLLPWCVFLIFIFLQPHVDRCRVDAATETQAGELAGYEHRFRALGTTVSISVYANDAKLLAAKLGEIEQEVEQLEQVLSDYRPESETSQLSVLGAEVSKQVSDTLWEVLVASDQWWRESDGAFDASLGRLTRLWREHRRSGDAPSTSEVEEALASCGWEKLTLNSTNQSVRFSEGKVRLDFGAIGKGYIVDRIYERLVESGYGICLVNISGNIRCGQAPPGRDGWRVEVSGLAEPTTKPGQSRKTEALRRILVADTALATSGDLWQYTLIDGVRRSHIIDPKTGYGVIGPTAATVLAPTATDADAFATVACIAKAEAVLAIAQRRGFEVLLAHRSEGGKIETRASPKFPPALVPQ